MAFAGMSVSFIQSQGARNPQRSQAGTAPVHRHAGKAPGMVTTTEKRGRLSTRGLKHLTGRQEWRSVCRILTHAGYNRAWLAGEKMQIAASAGAADPCGLPGDLWRGARLFS